MIDDLVQDGMTALYKSIREANEKIGAFRKITMKLEEDQQVMLIVGNPEFISKIENPSLHVQFLALLGMKEISEMGQMVFPKNSLFYEIQNENKGNVLNILTNEKIFFENASHFDLLMDYTSAVQKTLLPAMIRSLEPLTSEQRQIWNSKRLEILF